MSSMRNYDAACGTYDRLRIPIGVELYASFLSWRLQDAGPLAQLKVLDAGCGTGSYAQAMLEAGVGRVACVDASEGMLEKARRKLAGFGAERVLHIGRHAMPSFPTCFKPGTFHGVMLNQVLHHIESNHVEKTDRYPPASDMSSFPSHQQTFHTAHKLLTTGGVLMISTCSRAQFSELWWARYCPNAINYMHKLLPPLDVLEEMLVEAGFEKILRVVLPKEIITSDVDYMFDAAGPFDKSWRAVDSFWSILTDEELEEMLVRISAGRESGEVDEAIDRHRAYTEAAGPVTFFIAQKTAS